MQSPPHICVTAAAKSLQSCPTLCDPIDGSPPGSPVPGILQARTGEWVAIYFSNAWKWKVKVKSLSRVRLLVTPWTAAYQAPPSMGFSRQEYWSGVPLPSLHICVNQPLFLLWLSLVWSDVGDLSCCGEVLRLGAWFSWGEDWLHLDTCHCSRASSRDQECLLFAHLLYVFLIPSLHWLPHYLTFQIHIWAASRLLSYNSHTSLCAVRVITWRRKWQTTPVFLPGEFHGQRNLAGYSRWGCKELDTTEWLTHTHTHRIITRVSLPSKSPRKIKCWTTLLSKYFTLKRY